MSEVVRPGGAQVCGPNQTDKLGLRTGAIFVVLITSLVGTLFPIVAKRNRRLRAIIPGAIFEFGKFFGSGVILATALIHLLDPAMQLLGDTNTIAYGGCISNAWSAYPYALGLATSSLFLTFVGELYAYRIGTAYLAKRNISPKRVGGIRADDQSHAPLSEALNDDPADPPVREDRVAMGDVSRADAVLPTKDDGSQWSVEEQQWKDSSEQNPASAQLLGVAILEFGILFHSLIIGMTLSLSEPKEYTTLFIVLIFHQMFEGLGLGTRLAFLQLPKSWNWVPTASGVAYSVIAPLGMAIGLGTRETVSMTSGTASVVSGVLDSISAGILLYSATVELMAHEFIFTPHYHTCSWKRVNLVLFYFALGAGLMAVLGKWL